MARLSPSVSDRKVLGNCEIHSQNTGMRNEWGRNRGHRPNSSVPNSGISTFISPAARGRRWDG